MEILELPPLLLEQQAAAAFRLEQLRNVFMAWVEVLLEVG
jgi:hypothetical protein